MIWSALDGILWILNHTGLILPNDKDILSLRFLFSIFFVFLFFGRDYICGVRVWLLITWETSAIGQHGRYDRNTVSKSLYLSITYF